MTAAHPARSLYQDIEADLRRRLSAGALPPGSMIPGRRALAREYGVALPTVERAVAILLSEGLLRADNRRGTFVAETPAKKGAVRRTARESEPPGRPMRVGVVATLHQLDEGAENHRLWATAITSGIEQVVLHGGGTSLFVDRFQKGGKLRSLESILAEFRGSRVDALAVVGDGEPVAVTVPILERSGLPFVIVGGQRPLLPVNAVVADGRASGQMAARHLIGLGFRQIDFVAPFESDWILERYNGVLDAARESALPTGSVRIHPPRLQSYQKALRSSFHIYREPGYQFARPLFRAARENPAIVTVNDLTAFGILKAAQEAGRVPGRDFALIGFDDDPRARFERLSTLRPSLQEIGTEAGRLLLRLGEESALRRQVLVQPELIPRGSTLGFMAGHPA